MTADLDLRALLSSWELHLRAERKSPHTISVYTIGIRLFLAWAAATGRPPVLDKATARDFIAHLLDDGREAATARARWGALRRFTAWLTEEGELPADPLLTMKPPKLDTKVVPVLSTSQLKALLKACEGKDLRSRRDEALVRLMTETGLRAGEVLALEVTDVDLRDGVLLVARGKGGKGRLVPFGPQTGRALDRYLRLRKTHRLASASALWLGERGRGLGYDGLYWTLGERATRAGIRGFHAHVLRHTAASRWLAAGGSEGGLMAVAGWSRRDMLDRYVAATASERAAAESRGLDLGDL